MLAGGCCQPSTSTRICPRQPAAQACAHSSLTPTPSSLSMRRSSSTRKSCIPPFPHARVSTYAALCAALIMYNTLSRCAFVSVSRSLTDPCAPQICFAQQRVQPGLLQVSGALSSPRAVPRCLAINFRLDIQCLYFCHPLPCRKHLMPMAACVPCSTTSRTSTPRLPG